MGCGQGELQQSRLNLHPALPLDTHSGAAVREWQIPLPVSLPG